MALIAIEVGLSSRGEVFKGMVW